MPPPRPAGRPSRTPAPQRARRPRPARPRATRAGERAGAPPSRVASCSSVSVPRVRSAVDVGQDLLLRLLAEALHVAHAARRARPPPARPGWRCRAPRCRAPIFGQAQHLAQLEDPGRQPLAQLLELGAAPGLEELGDRRGRARRRSRARGQPALAHERAQVLGQPLQRARPALVGADLEGVRALDLQQGGDLAQGPRDGEPIEHGLDYSPARAGRAASPTRTCPGPSTRAHAAPAGFPSGRRARCPRPRTSR